MIQFNEGVRLFFATGTVVVGAFADDPAMRALNMTGDQQPSGVLPGDGIQSPPP
jgi:hypothetical protein